MEITQNTFQWLCSIGALTEYDVTSQDDKIVTLENEATQQFELGLKFPLILDKLHLLIVNIPSVTYVIELKARILSAPCKT